MNHKTVMILPEFYILVAASILLIPFSWLFSWILAALIHELFHILMVYAFGYRIRSIKIGLAGAIIETNMDSGWRNGICSLAGPLGGLLLFGFLRRAPRLALCGLIQSLYNLIPIMPLDGARALQSLLSDFFDNRIAQRIIQVVEMLMIGALMFLAWYAYMRLRLGLFPVISVLLLIWRNKKIPCKEMRIAVQ